MATIFNREIGKITKWFKLYHISLNVNKSNYILFHRKLKVIPQNLTPLCIDNESVLRVENTKFVSMFIVQELKCKALLVSFEGKFLNSRPLFIKLENV